MAPVFLLKNKTVPRDPYHDTFTESHFDPVFIPLLKHTQVNESQTIDILISDYFLHEIAAFIITSQRAVESIGATLEKIPADIRPLIFKKTVYTVGPATSKVLLDLGFEEIRGGAKAGNGSILSDIIMEDLKEGQDVVFFTGEIRRDIIPVKLAEGGINIKEFVIYKTEGKEGIIEDFRTNFDKSEGQDRWIVFFSPQGTADIVSHLKTLELNDVKIGSIGPTTEQYLKENGIKVDLVSVKPDAENLYKGMISL